MKKIIFIIGALTMSNFVFAGFFEDDCGFKDGDCSYKNLLWSKSSKKIRSPKEVESKAKKCKKCMEEDKEDFERQISYAKKLALAYKNNKLPSDPIPQNREDAVRIAEKTTTRGGGLGILKKDISSAWDNLKNIFKKP